MITQKTFKPEDGYTVDFYKDVAELLNTECKKECVPFASLFLGSTFFRLEKRINFTYLIPTPYVKIAPDKSLWLYKLGMETVAFDTPCVPVEVTQIKFTTSMEVK